MANNIVHNPSPTVRLPDQTRDQPRTNDQSRPGEPKLSANATGFFRLPDGAGQQQGGSGGDTSQNDGSNGGTGNTMLARAIAGLSDTGIVRISKRVVDNLTGRSVAPTPEVGAVQDNLAGVSTYGDGTFLRKNWDQMFASTQGRPLRVSGDIPAAEAAQMRAARTEANLNAGGVNPIVMSRDRALGNG
jgi:hypothetical protein